MRSAGIKVWVLTGDKVETAINIGQSSGLLDLNMKIFKMTAGNFDDNFHCLEMLESQIKAYEQLESSKRGRRKAKMEKEKMKNSQINFTNNNSNRGSYETPDGEDSDTDDEEIQS